MYYFHPHPLTLSYSFVDQHEYGSRCRACREEFDNEYWLYKCSKCLYYLHFDCPPPDLKPGNIKDFFKKWGTHGMPLFPLDKGLDILQIQIPSKRFEEVSDENGYFKHSSHVHPLTLIQHENIHDTDTLLHNPMKRIKLVCNGCLSPVTTMPFYTCSQEHECCNFVLHEWCTRLPTELKNHPIHEGSHTLVLLPNQNVFSCKICQLPSNGFAYNCSTCEDYKIDVKCGFIPRKIRHDHVFRGHTYLDLYKPRGLIERSCYACHNTINADEMFYKSWENFKDLDIRCALYLPKTIRHKCDTHTLELHYSPIENHKGQYFCEICEEDLNPEKWFYHCLQCRQSIHSACAPLILKSEQGVNSVHTESVYQFVNMKFGGVHNIKDHEHPVSFVPGTKTDGDCSKCLLKLQSRFILKCLQCEYAIHCYCESSVAEVTKQELVSMFDDLEKSHEPERKTRVESRIPFYPNESVPVRPTTLEDSHWWSKAAKMMMERRAIGNHEAGD